MFNTFVAVLLSVGMMLVIFGLAEKTRPAKEVTLEVPPHRDPLGMTCGKHHEFIQRCENPEAVCYKYSGYGISCWSKKTN